MRYREASIRALFIILGLFFLLLGIMSKQWEHVREILTKVIEYENGGLP